MPKAEKLADVKPHIHVDEKDLPAIKKWKVGNTYELKLKVRQVSYSEDDFDGKKQNRAGFEVIEIEPYDSAPGFDEDD